MAAFQRILVGIDLAQAEQPDVAHLYPVVKDTVRSATWLASRMSARLLFFSALDLSEAALHAPPRVSSGPARTVEEAANQMLADLVKSAEGSGAAAAGKLVRGRGWVEIIREVLRGKHDLVMVGTRDLHGMRRLLSVSRALKLLHECPGPVWVVKPGTNPHPRRILAATDLSPVAEHALRAAVEVAKVTEAELHVLHMVQYPLDHHWSTGDPDPTTLTYHRQVRDEARARLHEQLERTAYRDLRPIPQIHIADELGLPELPILNFSHDHPIDLLVLGTHVRGGLDGALLGNTAERILPELHCSILAVKPPDFVSPITLE